MKILYVVSRPLEINTSASIRNRSTIEGLLQLGHDVDIITTQPDKNHLNYDESILIQDLNVTYLKLTGVQNLASISRKLRIFAPLREIIYEIISKLRIYDNLKGMISHISDAGISNKSYDLIISSSDPKSSHLFVGKMFENKLIRDVPWIQIWGDPFLSDITRKNKLLDIQIKKEEKRLLKYATKVIYVSNLTLKEQQKIYAQYSNKMFYVPIPYSKEEQYLVDNLKKDSMTFLYSGDYYSHVRNIKPLYEAIKDTDHNLVICGDGDIKLEATEKIKILSRVSFQKTKDFERGSDVLVHLSNAKGTQIPGKIYQYTGTNKYILFILDGRKEEIVDSFKKYNRFIFCENNIDDIKAVINQIKVGLYDSTRIILNEFNPKKVAENIIKF